MSNVICDLIMEDEMGEARAKFGEKKNNCFQLIGTGTEQQNEN